MSGINISKFNLKGEIADWSNTPGFMDSMESIKIKPRDTIIRLLDFTKRDLLNRCFTELGITKDTELAFVQSDDDLKIKTYNFKLPHLIMSMHNFKLFLGSTLLYTTGSTRNLNFIYKDTSHIKAAILAINKIIPEDTKYIQLTEQQTMAKHHTYEKDSEYLVHPAAIKAGKLPKSTRYNEKTCRYELQCDVCGEWHDESNVQSFYSRENGYVNKCKNCSNYTSKLGSLSRMEKIAANIGGSLDNYSFDGK